MDSDNDLNNVPHIRWRACRTVTRSAHVCSAGYTLLEVLLALGLTVVIFAAIAAGIRVHLISIGKAQARIEQRQVARNLLALIGRDIRAAVLYRAVDYSGLENIRATQLKQTQQSPLALLAGATATNADAVDPTTTDDDATDDEEIEEVIQEDAVSYRPVLKGGRSSILFDISRLPRLDQYRLITSQGIEAADSTPSDIKSIGYFFSDAPPTNTTIAESDTNAQGGLYRHEIDRAVAAFAGLDGLRSSPDSFSQLLAPEVAGIGFRYFDGQTWATSWDFDEKNGLPTAIEIELLIDPTRTRLNSQTLSEPSMQMTFRSVVQLPLAEPVEDNDE